MSFRSKVKKNIPKVALDSIWSMVVGGYKGGKTRLWKDVTELHYSNPEEAMLIAFESGYETWELDNIIAVHEEAKTEEDAWKVWKYFKTEIVTGLVAEATSGNRVVKLIGVDTCDRCVDAASAWLIYDRSKKYGKPISSVQEITTVSNGDENGWTALYEELKKPFDQLRNAGYGIMGLAWTKVKEETTYSGLKYNTVELMMNNTARKVFESQASFICCLFNEVSITDKNGNELDTNLKDKKGKERATNFHKTEVMMYFRPSEYISIAGGRYVNLPEEPVPYSAENYIEVFENAVKGQLKKTDKSVEEIKIEEEEKREEKAQEFANSFTVEDLHTKIANKMKATSIDKKKQVAPEINTILDGKYNRVDECFELDKLQQIWGKVSSL